MEALGLGGKIRGSVIDMLKFQMFSSSVKISMNSIPVSLNFLYFRLYSQAFLDSRFFLFSFSLTY